MKRDIDAIRSQPGPILERLDRPVRRGGKWVARCPLHQEKTASLHVTQRQGRWSWVCFGCGLKGDAIDLTRRLDNCSFHEACDRLGAPRTVSDDRPGETEDERRLRLMDTMPLPKPPWATDDFVVLYCDCGVTHLNRPSRPASLRRESLECGRCGLEFAKALDETGEPRPAGLYGRSDEGDRWVAAFVGSLRHDSTRSE